MALAQCLFPLMTASIVYWVEIPSGSCLCLRTISNRLLSVSNIKMANWLIFITLKNCLCHCLVIKDVRCNVKNITQSKVLLLCVLSYYGSFVYKLLWRNKNIQIREFATGWVCVFLTETQLYALQKEVYWM